MVFSCTEAGISFRYLASQSGGDCREDIFPGPNDILIINSLEGKCTIDSEYNNSFYILKENESVTLFYPMGSWKTQLIATGEYAVILIKVDVVALHSLLTGDSEPDYKNIVRKGYFPINKGAAVEVTKISPQLKLVLHQIIHPPVGNKMLMTWVRAKITEFFAMSLDSGVQKSEGSRCPFLQHTELFGRMKELKNRLTEYPEPDSIVNIAAAEWKISGHALRTGFKQTFGKSIRDFCHEIKMERARELLYTADVSVNDVAYRVGYSNPSHFIAAFKKRFGSTPAQFALEGRMK